MSIVHFFEKLSEDNKEIFDIIAGVGLDGEPLGITARDIYERMGGRRLEKKRLWPKDYTFIQSLDDAAYVAKLGGKWYPSDEMANFTYYPYRFFIYLESYRHIHLITQFLQEQGIRYLD